MRILLLAAMATCLSIQAQLAVQGFNLPNGMRVLLLEDHERPLVRMRLHLGIEPSDTPQGRQGLAQLLVRMLDRGETADLKADDLTRMLDESGIQFSIALDRRGMNWQMVARSRDQDRAMGLLADRLLRSVFLPDVLASQRLACLRQEGPQEDSPLERLKRLLLLEPSSRPTLKSLGAITLDELLTFQARVLRPERAILILHGDLGLEQAKRLVLLNLGSWPTRQLPPGTTWAPLPVPAGPLAVPAPLQGFRIQAVAPIPPEVSPEVAALLSLLVPGDPILSPVYVDLKEDALMATLDGSDGSAGSSAMSLLLRRLDALRGRGFTAGDLVHARTAWEGRRLLASLHPEAQMDSALREALGGGIKGGRVSTVTLEELNAGLLRWLDPANIRTGIAGNPDLLKSLERPTKPDGAARL